jgi:hypothetical protein
MRTACETRRQLSRDYNRSICNSHMVSFSFLGKRTRPTRQLTTLRGYSRGSACLGVIKPSECVYLDLIPRFRFRNFHAAICRIQASGERRIFGMINSVMRSSYSCTTHMIIVTDCHQTPLRLYPCLKRWQKWRLQLDFFTGDLINLQCTLQGALQVT